MIKFISDTTDRLDKFMASKVEVSRSRVQKAIRDGLVSVNKKKINEPDFGVKAGDMVELPEFASDDLIPSNLELKVVFENTDLAVIDKPAGLVVHPGAGNKEDTLANALLTRFLGIEKVGEPHRPGIVHRLDEDTSGLIVIAKTQQAYEYLKQAFQDRNVEKEYLALVHGRVAKLHDMIDLPLIKDPNKQKMRIGQGSTLSGKVALTEYRVLSAVDLYSLLKVKLHTGRTHQIRAHLSHIGHPIVGDAVYGTQDREIIDRQFLHAHRLKFQLMDGTWLELESELPSDLKQALEKLNIPSRT
jgi:23S rRNA pseudouridine1911/1915/1917 synthase